MAMQEEVVIVAAKRSAIGSFLGTLKDCSALDLATQVAQAVIKESGIDKTQIDSLILGQVLQGACGQNIARRVLMNCEIGTQKCAYLVNIVCGSGLEAVRQAYNDIILGESQVVLAGGVENMSQAPFYLKNMRIGAKMGHQEALDSLLYDGLWCEMSGTHMGITAENLAQQYKITREEQDEFAYNSHKKAATAIANGAFKNEIHPLIIKNKKSEIIFDEDEFVRKDIDLANLAKLRPAFKGDGSVTAGNSSGINDGAAILLLASKTKAQELNLPILASIKGFAKVGVDPKIMGIGAAMAAKKVLEKCKLSLTDIDLIEANEAFAAQSIASIKELGANAENINVNGGAISLGHPLGCSGARILTTLVHAMKNRGKNLGLATLCIGGGQGIAAIVESK